LTVWPEHSVRAVKYAVVWLIKHGGGLRPPVLYGALK